MLKFPRIEIYYDVVSPYSYFGFVTLNRYQKMYDLNVTYTPFFLGGVYWYSFSQFIPFTDLVLLTDFQALCKRLAIVHQLKSLRAASTCSTPTCRVVLTTSKCRRWSCRTRMRGCARSELNFLRFCISFSSLCFIISLSFCFIFLLLSCPIPND
jgi:hypothetical protein